MCVSVFAQPVGDDTGSKPGTSKTEQQPETKHQPGTLEAIERGIDRIARALEAQNDEANAKKKEAHEAADLQAQKDQAFWAMVMFWAATAQAFLTLVGIVLIARTLVHTRNAAEAAHAMVIEGEKAVAAALAAAVEAKRQADLAEQSFKRLERPYMFLFGIRDLEHEGGFPLAKFSIANYGKTPAIIENFRALASVGTEPDTPLRVDDAHPLFSSPIISAGERRDNLEQAVDIPYRSPELFSAPVNIIIPRLDDAKKELFIWMIINYRGPFSRGHETSACWRYDRNSDHFVQYGHEDYNYVEPRPKP